MKLIKRAPLWGAMVIILIIILLINMGVSIIYSKKENFKLKEDNNSLSTTVDKQRTAIETLKTEKIELEEKIAGLEQELQINNSSYISYTTRKTEDIVSRSNETRDCSISLDDREILARLVFLEANTESLECQKAITSVIINRLNSGYWGNTIKSVVYARGQFTPAARIPHTTPTSTNYEAVDYVLANGPTLPSYVLYFRAGYHFGWNGYTPYSVIGNTYFGYMAKNK